MLQESVGYERDVCERKCCSRVWVMTGMLHCLSEEGPKNYR